MSETIKLLPEELNKITDIRRNYFNIQTAVGQIHLSRHNLNTQLENLDKQEHEIMEEYSKTQTAEQDCVKGLQDKYGLGTLDIQNGSFIPSATEETTSVTEQTTEKTA
tara:strand:- start:501 stop:824 length:324 start_codon:yes stop_codon:yes gene_type:complete